MAGNIIHRLMNEAAHVKHSNKQAVSCFRRDKTATAMSTNLPEDVSLSKWEDSGFEWSEQVAPRSFERLNVSCQLSTSNQTLSLKPTYIAIMCCICLLLSKGEIWFDLLALF